MNKVAHLLALCLFGICATALGQSVPTTGPRRVQICDILKAPGSFDGRELLISGVAGNTLHSVLLWEPECTLPEHGGAIQIRFADSKVLATTFGRRYLRMLRREGGMHLTAQGKFRSTGGPFGPNGVAYEFTITSILDVQKLSDSYKRLYDIGTGKGGERCQVPFSFQERCGRNRLWVGCGEWMWAEWFTTDGTGLIFVPACSKRIYQGRYKSLPVETGPHFLRLVRYVERNAQRAGLVKKAEDWPGSSVSARLYGTKKQLLSRWPVAEPKDYVPWLNHSQPKEEIENIRYALKRSRPYGSEPWVSKAVARFGLENTLRNPWRPKKGSR